MILKKNKVREFHHNKYEILHVSNNYLCSPKFPVSILYPTSLLIFAFYFDFHNQFFDFATHLLVLVVAIFLGKLLIGQYNIRDINYINGGIDIIMEIRVCSRRNK